MYHLNKIFIGDYRFGFNGQEKDNEVYREGSAYSFEFEVKGQASLGVATDQYGNFGLYSSTMAMVDLFSLFGGPEYGYSNTVAVTNVLAFNIRDVYWINKTRVDFVAAMREISPKTYKDEFQVYSIEEQTDDCYTSLFWAADITINGETKTYKMWSGVDYKMTEDGAAWGTRAVFESDKEND